MKKFLVIPGVFAILGLTYIATYFVKLNPDEIVVHLGPQTSADSTAIGFVVLTSFALGMLVAGFLSGIEILALMIQNRRLKRKLNALSNTLKAPKKVETLAPSDIDVMNPKPSGRFT
jgi:hypothetical protein